MKKLIAPLLTTTLLFGLVACSEEVPPEANSATCAPGEAYKEALSEISSPAKRRAFAEDCKTVHKHEESEAAAKHIFAIPPLIPIKP